jgi:energy-coupling factor transporter ATP-binding protein EcfA2
VVRLIGIVGRAGSGKSTLASSLCALLPRAVPVSLATPFKLEGVAVNDLPVAEVFGPDAKSDVTRQALQRAGTEHGRDTYGPDIWLKHADADIYRLGRYGTQHIVCDDVRFDNEAAWVRANGGALIKLVGRQALMTGEAATHPSETAIDAIVGDLVLNTSVLDPNAAAILAYGFLLGFQRPVEAPTTNAHVEGGE